jgi:ribosome biogenesis protein BRX1
MHWSGREKLSYNGIELANYNVPGSRYSYTYYHGTLGSMCTAAKRRVRVHLYEYCVDNISACIKYGLIELLAIGRRGHPSGRDAHALLFLSSFPLTAVASASKSVRHTMKSKLAAMRGKVKASGGDGAKPEGHKARAKRLRAEADQAEGESGVRLPLLQNDDTLSSDDEEEKARRTKIVQRRILILSARGVVSRFRHLMNDIKLLTPHHKSDAKFSNHAPLREINEICEMKACATCLLFESRKGKDLFLWLAKTPHGPSMKFQLQNMHTMNELNFTGNCLQGSRPVLCFDSKFNKTPELQLVKELLTQVFAAPAQHVRTQPFVDRVYSFMLADGRIFFRHYQIITPTAQQDADLAKELVKKGADSNDLIEIGPRFVMNPIKMFAGSFGGATLFANAKCVSSSSSPPPPPLLLLSLLLFGLPPPRTLFGV